MPKVNAALAGARCIQSYLAPQPPASLDALRPFGGGKSMATQPQPRTGCGWGHPARDGKGGPMRPLRHARKGRDRGAVAIGGL